MHELNPPLELRVIDIDAVDTPNDLHDRYDLQVPVILLERNDFKGMIELPRVSPRLNGEGLFRWMLKALITTVGLD